MMNYHGYIGHVEYDDEQHIFTGSVINTRDVITFQGETVQELEKAFRDSVDDYLAWCREDGIEPEKIMLLRSQENSIEWNSGVLLIVLADGLHSFVIE